MWLLGPPFLHPARCQPQRILASQDAIVFPAFEETQLLTFGSDRRRIDWEGEWRRQLRRVGKGKPQEGSAWSNTIECGCGMESDRGWLEGSG